MQSPVLTLHVLVLATSHSQSVRQLSPHFPSGHAAYRKKINYVYLLDFTCNIYIILAIAINEAVIYVAVHFAIKKYYEVI